MSAVPSAPGPLTPSPPPLFRLPPPRPAAARDSVVNALVIGAATGGLHAVAALDHLAVLTPVSLGRSPATAASAGALWGLGHGAGQAALGVLLLLAASRFEAIKDRLEPWAGVALGANLVIVGLQGLREAYAEHHDPGCSHAGSLAASRAPLRMLGIGVLCGMQFDSIVPLLPVLTVGDTGAAVAFIAASGLTGAVAMSMYAGLLSVATRRLAQKVPDIQHRLVVWASAAAVVIGSIAIASSLGVRVPLLG